MSISTIQNFFKETITRAVSLVGATNIYVSALPTPDEGYVVISPSSSSLREIIYYTAKGTDGNGTYLTVTLANRGLGGTTAQTHAIGEPVRMNVTAEHIKEISDALDQIVAGGTQDASTIAKGISKLSVAPISASNPIAVGDNDPRLSPYDKGDGSDGDVTISSGTTTLTRDTFYNNLTVSGTGILNTAGFRFFVKGVLTVDASSGACVTNSGGNGGDGANADTGDRTAGAAGAGGAAGTLPGGTVGKAGIEGINAPSSGPINGTNGTAGDNKTHTIVNETGAKGGNGSSYGDPVGGDGGTASAVTNLPRTSISSYFLIDLTSTTAFQQMTVNAGSGSGANGGTGASGNGAAGGGSGGGGGIVWFSCGTLNITGTGAIKSLGGNGGKGGNSGFGKGAGGGGGGGVGGVIFAIYNNKIGTGTMLVSGGTGGVGGTGGGTAGENGHDGLVIEITN